MARRASAGGAIATGAILLIVSLGALAQTLEQRKKLDAQRQTRRIIPATNQTKSNGETPAEPKPVVEGKTTACISKPGQGPDMVLIAGGTFEQGSTESDGGDPDERPQHRVTIARPFALSRCEVTVEEFNRFVEDTGYKSNAEKRGGCYVWNSEVNEWKRNRNRNWKSPGFEQTDRHPVTCVSWNDANAYIKWLNEALELPADTYRLPTESEWEFATRAGNPTVFPWGDGSQCDFANAADSALRESVNVKGWEYADCDDGFAYTAPVASLKPNVWGLYDLSGNVWEWVADCWHETYQGAPQDGKAWQQADGDGEKCEKRSVRGGSWSSEPTNLRSAIRGGFRADGAGSNDGFRLARTL